MHLLYIFFNKHLCNNSEFSSRIYAFVAKHKDLCFYRSSCCRRPLWRQISGWNSLLSKQENSGEELLRGRMIGRSIKGSSGGGWRWKFCVMKRESDRKCVNRARAQSFDRCEKFVCFQIAVSQSKLASLILTPSLGILWISVCSFWLCGSIVAYPIIYRLIPSPSRFETRQCTSKMCKILARVSL